MDTKIKLIILFCALSVNANAQNFKVQLRPSIGWGRGWSFYSELNTNQEYFKVERNRYRKIYNQKGTDFRRAIGSYLGEVLSPPQFGLELELNYNVRHTLGIGFMHGLVENSNVVYYGEGINYEHCGGIDKGNLQKFLLSYSYSFNWFKNKKNILGQLRFSTYSSIATTILDGTDYEIPTFFTNSNGQLISFINKNIGKTGTMATLGFKVGFYDRQKNNEKFTVTFMYDHGFNTVFSTKVHIDYLETVNGISENKYLDYTTKSKGDQLKISFSYPINLYKYKPKYNNE